MSMFDIEGFLSDPSVEQIDHCKKRICMPLRHILNLQSHQFC